MRVMLNRQCFAGLAVTPILQELCSSGIRWEHVLYDNASLSSQLLTFHQSSVRLALDESAL